MHRRTLKTIIRFFGMLKLLVVLLFVHEVDSATDNPTFNIEIQEQSQRFFKSLPIQTILDEAKTRDDPIAIHLFWGANIPEKALRDEYNPNRTVHIGGSKWHDYFFEGLDTFLLNTPANVRIIFTHCPLTYTANQTALDACAEKFKGRFFLCPLADAINHFKVHHPDSNLDQALELATMGQAAVASDVYRLVATDYVGRHLILDPKNRRMTNTYADIDTFLNMMGFGGHNYFDDYDDYFKSQAPLLSVLLIAPEEGSYQTRIGRRTGNDIVRIRPSLEKPIEWFVNLIIESNRYDSAQFSSYRSLFKGLEENPHFDGKAYLEEHKTVFAVLPEIHVINVFGPYYVESLGRKRIMSALPYFQTTSTISWDKPKLSWAEAHLQMSCINSLERMLSTKAQELFQKGQSLLSLNSFFARDINPFLAFPPNQDTEDCLSIFQKYLDIFWYTNRLGLTHPFNLTLQKKLKEHSPFKNERYKKGFAYLFPTNEDREAIRAFLIEREKFQFYAVDTTDTQILFYYARSRLRESGMDEDSINQIIPLVPAGVLRETY